ncbi:His/Gly/Thr/Pro-type tRNA ligase C-terminal domain-containing protein, partial [Bacillus altitudinis]|uniref:His/Gly/Thr/Pro-type tRNA ligase C-terminal domain-containing protein n=1 Tax=Bacillus altitudinis TaxID=293387 RepID=UPI001F1A87CA
MDKEGVVDDGYELKDGVARIGGAEIDGSDKQGGWKLNECEMEGMALGVEVGGKDMEKGEVMVGRGESGEKEAVRLDGVEERMRWRVEE